VHLLAMNGSQSGSWVHRSDRPAPAPGTDPLAEISVISPDYFRTMGIRLIAGREFDDRDTARSPWALIINQTAARQFYPGEDPIGKRMVVSWGMIDPPQKDFEIVGVAADMRQDALDVKPEPCMYLAQTQGPSPYVSLLVRTRGKPANLTAEVKEQVREVSPAQGIQDVQSMDAVIGDSIARPKLEVTILGLFGMVALVLACVGIYAVISYSVQQRTREMGIRQALGAAPRIILGMVLREGLLLAAAGIGAGLVAALVLTRYLQSLLYTIRPTDPGVYGAVTAVLIVAAAAGCYFPARRATRVDPAVVLREE
jgi:predicted permease